jgi:hypothetical protein
MTSSDSPSLPMRHEIRAWRIADAVASAWWTAGGGDEAGIPLGVLAALSLVSAAGQPRPGLADQIPALGQDRFASFLSRVWGLFAIARPELSIRTGPFARWLQDGNTESRRAAAYATARTLLTTTTFPEGAERAQIMGADLLGCAYQALANPRGTKARGEVYTSADVAELLMQIKLTGATPRAEHPRGGRRHRIPAARGSAGPARQGHRPADHALVRGGHRSDRGRRPRRQRAPVGTRAPRHPGPRQLPHRTGLARACT